ncbi:MAG: class I SAM-dependent methyltransferase [Planctomycetota bacterium]|jgi:2-polyprenyl-3-methyl-5-hydroxy-6-metoxy-1,4-benzoquinol methylase
MSVFFEIAQTPVFCNVLWSTRDAAIDAATGSIRLAHCSECSLVYNVAFENRLVEYDLGYENSLHASAQFRRYSESLAAGLIERYGVRSKRIVEIGCGQADFLKLLCKRGGNRGHGFDPSFDPQRAGPLPESVTVTQETYNEALLPRGSELICCRHVLEHVGRPLEFLQSLRRAIGDHQQTIVFFEVPNAPWIFEQLGIWDIIYEHCSYFTARALANLFVCADFDVLRIAPTFENQFLTIEAVPRPQAAKPATGRAVDSGPTSQFVTRFGETYREKTGLWRHRLAELEARRARAVVWGAGSKGVTFVNVMNVSDQVVPFLVDLNPYKQGKYVARTGQRVIAPDDLSTYEPDVVIIMNPVYRDEIRQALDTRGVRADVLVA